ncbi:hypothetical protein HaLaN_08085 [Haematococcus lacustris]|uniref:Uncharacterized protein n=1 Tax=Haematococcus lacustris TaxID=44745 RepID=A0A699ZA37_HAELA|nr:hypothetical protein HaLaN_08085 [Haematococcus lacustris]
MIVQQASCVYIYACAYSTRDTPYTMHDECATAPAGFLQAVKESVQPRGSAVQGQQADAGQDSRQAHAACDCTSWAR